MAVPHRTAAALATSSAACLLALVGAVRAHPGPDRELHAWVVQHRTAGLTTVLTAVTDLGSGPAVGVAVTAAVVLARRTGAVDRRGVAAVAGVLVLGVGVRLALAQLLHRERPSAADWAASAAGYALPSGHTTTSALGAGLVGWLVGQVRPSARRVTLTAALLYGGAVGASRVYLGMHWPTDVLAGWLLATCWLALAYLLVRRRLPVVGGTGQPSRG